MMKLVSGPHLLPWAEGVIGFAPRDDAKAIGVVDADGTIRSVTVFDNFSPCDCNMHIASDGSKRWLTRIYLRTAFYYPFVQVGLRRVTGLVPASNSAALHFDLHLGFVREGLCRNALPDDDLIVLGMLREHCRFIPQEFRNMKGFRHGR